MEQINEVGRLRSENHENQNHKEKTRQELLHEYQKTKTITNPSLSTKTPVSTLRNPSALYTQERNREKEAGRMISLAFPLAQTPSANVDSNPNNSESHPTDTLSRAEKLMLWREQHGIRKSRQMNDPTTPFSTSISSSKTATVSRLSDKRSTSNTVARDLFGSSNEPTQKKQLISNMNQTQPTQPPNEIQCPSTPFSSRSLSPLTIHTTPMRSSETTAPPTSISTPLSLHQQLHLRKLQTTIHHLRSSPKESKTNLTLDFSPVYDAMLSSNLHQARQVFEDMRKTYGPEIESVCD
jgi:hypothetical protein